MRERLPDDEMNRPETRLAVYGSLAPGRENAHMLAGLTGTWSEGTIRGTRVIDGGWGSAIGYPGVRLDPDADEIAVLVLESPELPEHWERLDAFEGAEYERVIAEVARTGGESVHANVYVIPPASE